MTGFDFANSIRARPAQAELMRVLGDPRGAREVPAAQRGAFVPDPTWARSHLVRVPIARLPGWPRYAGQAVSAVTVHRLAAEHLVATWAEVRRRGLHTRLHSYDGAFMARHMLWNPQNDLSVHAWGLALDFDASTNRFGIPAAQMGIDRAFARCMEECGWTWGGRWGKTDGMHFQLTDPLPGTTVPSWQDAMSKGQPAPVPQPAPVATPTPPAPAGNVTIWVHPEDIDGVVDTSQVLSIPVTADGQLRVNAQGRPKIVIVPEGRHDERKVL